MALSAYQWSYNSLTAGAGTAYRTVKFDGFFDLAELRTSDQPRLATDGMYPGLDIEQGLTLTIGLVIQGGSDSGLQTLLAALVTATAVQPSTPLALAFNLPGFGSQHYLARPRKRAVPLLPSYKKGWTKDVVIEFFAADPTLYPGES
jgi:hypothetical protein